MRGSESRAQACSRHAIRSVYGIDLAVLGQGAKPLIASGHPVADHEVGERFVESSEPSHSLVMSGADHATLQTGNDWPFPIPLVKDAAGWRFDTAAGQQEIINRRIGRNELDTVQACLAYVDAQREYYQRNPENAALPPSP